MARTRLLTVDDADALTVLLNDNRDFLAPTDPRRDESYFTAAGQREVIHDLLEKHRSGTALPYVILDERAEVVGRITLNEIVRGPFQSCSVGYWVAEPANGRGLATDALGAITTIAFDDLGLHRVQAGTLEANLASQQVLERNGFQRYGLAPAYLKIAGRWQDHILWQLLTPHPD